MGEFEKSLVSACSTVILLSKLLDFQKNICKNHISCLNELIDADHFIRELAKIEPKNMKKYNLEMFLARKS